MSELRPQIRRFIGMWNRKTQTHGTNRILQHKVLCYPWYSLWGGTHDAKLPTTLALSMPERILRGEIWYERETIEFGMVVGVIWGFAICDWGSRSAWVIICNNLRLRVLCGFPVKRMRSGNVAICTCFDVKCDTNYGNVPIDIDLVLILSARF